MSVAEETYVEISDAELENYQKMMALNKELRGKAVEELRLWCQANKGTETVEEGLKACTPAELCKLMGSCTATSQVLWPFYDWADEMRIRLEDREKATAAELAALAARGVVALPEEGEDDGQHHGI